MIYTIKDLEAVTLAMFDAVGTDHEEEAMEELETAENENAVIFWHMMDELASGQIDAIRRTGNGRNCHIYTRSIRHADTVQKTCFMIDESGDLLPLSHDNILLTDRKNYDYEVGTYETFKY